MGFWSKRVSDVELSAYCAKTKENIERDLDVFLVVVSDTNVKMRAFERATGFGTENYKFDSSPGSVVHEVQYLIDALLKTQKLSIKYLNMRKSEYEDIYDTLKDNGLAR